MRSTVRAVTGTAQSVPNGPCRSPASRSTLRRAPLSGADDLPAELGGHGAISPDLARALARSATTARTVVIGAGAKDGKRSVAEQSSAGPPGAVRSWLARADALRPRGLFRRREVRYRNGSWSKDLWSVRRDRRGGRRARSNLPVPWLSNAGPSVRSRPSDRFRRWRPDLPVQSAGLVSRAPSRQDLHRMGLHRRSRRNDQVDESAGIPLPRPPRGSDGLVGGRQTRTDGQPRHRGWPDDCAQRRGRASRRSAVLTLRCWSECDGGPTPTKGRRGGPLGARPFTPKHDCYEDDL